MKEDYKKCYKKLRKDTLPKPLEELENDIISDSPDENFPVRMTGTGLTSALFRFSPRKY